MFTHHGSRDANVQLVHAAHPAAVPRENLRRGAGGRFATTRSIRSGSVAIAGLLAVAAAMPAGATVTVFTDRTLWEATVREQCEDFESDELGNHSTPYTTAGGTVVSRESAGSPLTIQVIDGGNVNGSRELLFRDFEAGVRFTLPCRGNAFGFDYLLAFGGWTLSANGQSTVLPAFTSGFVGYVDDTDDIPFFVLTGDSGAQGGISLDNLCYAACCNPCEHEILAALADLKAEIVDLKAELVDVKAEIVDSVGGSQDVKAEIVDVKAELVDLKAEVKDIAQNTDPCVDPPPNMVGWWALDEQAPATSADMAGANADDGAWQGSPSPLMMGQVDGALCFNRPDGTPPTDFVQVPDAPPDELDFGPEGTTGSFSIDCWLNVNPADATGVRVIVDKRVASPTRGYSFFLSGNQLALQLADGAAPGNTCGSAPNSFPCTNYGGTTGVATGNWVHVAVTVDRSGPNATAVFYVNGVAGAPVNVNSRSHPLRTLANTAPLRIANRSGAAGLGGNAFLVGCVDELEIFNRVLMPLEVKAIFDAGHDGKCKGGD